MCVLYLGSADYRHWARCPVDHRSGRCLQCVKRSVSLMPAVLAEESMVIDAASTYQRSVALEDLGAPRVGRALLLPGVRRQLAPDLSRYLTREQEGVLAVSRSMIDRVLCVRALQASGATAAPVLAGVPRSHDHLGAIFHDRPADSGHWGGAYFVEVLAPLRRVPPGYVLDIEAGDFDRDELRSSLPDGVVGVAIVRLREQG